MKPPLKSKKKARNAKNKGRKNRESSSDSDTNEEELHDLLERKHTVQIKLVSPPPPGLNPTFSVRALGFEHTITIGDYVTMNEREDARPREEDEDTEIDEDEIEIYEEWNLSDSLQGIVHKQISK